MDISKYIEDLLEEHEYVIVPALGAFFSSYCPAKFNENKNILLPPSRTVSFNPELKINDGLLTKHISQQQKISLTQASRAVENFTGDVLYHLELGEEFFVGKIGSLRQKKGVLKFFPEESLPENPESFGLQPVAISDDDTPSDSNEELTTEVKKLKRFSRWMWGGLFLLFLFTAVALFLLFFTDHKTVKTTEPIIQKDTLIHKMAVTPKAHDSAMLVQKEINPVSKDSVTVQLRKELYYTIGGSFRSLKNANDYYEKMSLKGFHPIQLGLIGNYYLVALDTFQTVQEAYEAADQYAHKYQNTEIWIFHPK